MVRAGATVFRVINFSSDMLFGLVYKDERSWKGSTAAVGKEEHVVSSLAVVLLHTDMSKRQEANCVRISLV